MLTFGSSHELYSSHPTRRTGTDLRAAARAVLAKDRNPLSPSLFLSGNVGTVVACHFVYLVPADPSHLTYYSDVGL